MLILIGHGTHGFFTILPIMLIMVMLFSGTALDEAGRIGIRLVVDGHTVGHNSTCRQPVTQDSPSATRLPLSRAVSLDHRFRRSDTVPLGSASVVRPGHGRAVGESVGRRVRQGARAGWVSEDQNGRKVGGPALAVERCRPCVYDTAVRNAGGLSSNSQKQKV